MTDFLTKIITNAGWAILSIIILWWILYFVFTYLIKLTAVQWKKLDYFWIFTGFLGLISLINQNGKDLIKGEREFVRQEIKLNTSFLENHLSNWKTCFIYTKSNLSPNDFEDRQYDQDQICEWSKEFILDYDSITGLPKTKIDTITIKSISFKTDFMDDYVSEFLKYAQNINTNIEKYKSFETKLNSSFWEDFYRSGGVILLIFAFSIKLSITTRNVKLSKTEKKT